MNQRFLSKPSEGSFSAVFLGLLLITQLLLSLVVFRGYHGGDDYRYCVLAAELIEDTGIDTRAFPAYFKVRWGLLLPMAAAFRVFGVHEWAALLPQFGGALIGTIGMFLLAGVLLGRRAALPCAAIYALMPYTLRGASLVLADFPALHLSTLGMGLFFYAGRTAKSARPWLAAASALVFSAAWISKSSVMCLAPLLAVALVYGWMRRRELRVPILTFVGVAGLCLGSELAFYAWTQGDPLHRLTGLEETISAFEHLWDGMTSPRRFFVDGPRALVNYGAFGPVVLVSFLAAGLVSRWRRLLPLVAWLFYLAFFFNFMTTSFDSYKPIRPISIYFLFLAQPAILLVVGAGLEFGDRLKERSAIGPTLLSRAWHRWLFPVTISLLCLTSVGLEWRHKKVNSRGLRSGVQWLHDNPSAQAFVRDQKRAWEIGFLGAPDRVLELQGSSQRVLDSGTVLSFGENQELTELVEAKRGKLKVIGGDGAQGFSVLRVTAGFDQ